MAQDYFGDQTEITGFADLCGEVMLSAYNNETMDEKVANAEMDLYLTKLDAGLISPDTPFKPSESVETPTFLEGADSGLTDFYGEHYREKFAGVLLSSFFDCLGI